MEENIPPRGVRIIGIIYVILGMIFLIGGFLLGGLISEIFPIFEYVLSKPIRFLLNYLIPVQSTEFGTELTGVSLFDFRSWPISAIGGMIIFIVGLALKRGKDLSLFMILFSFSAIIGVYGLSFISSLFILANLLVGYYFLNLRRKRMKDAKYAEVDL